MVDYRAEFVDPAVARLELAYLTPRFKSLYRVGTSKTFRRRLERKTVFAYHEFSTLADALYSGTTVIYRIMDMGYVRHRMTDFYMLLVFVGQYDMMITYKGRTVPERVLVFAEHSSGQIFCTDVEFDFDALGPEFYYALPYPLRLSEFGDNVELARRSSLKLAEGGAAPMPGFKSPLVPSSTSGLASLPIDIMASVLEDGILDVYAAQLYNPGLVHLSTIKVGRAEDTVFRIQRLAKRGYKASVVPFGAVTKREHFPLLFTRILMPPLELRAALESNTLFCRVATVTKSTPKSDYVPSASRPVAADKLRDLPPGVKILFQPVAGEHSYYGEFLGLGLTPQSVPVLLLYISEFGASSRTTHTVTMVPLDAVQRYAREGRVWTWGATDDLAGHYFHVTTRFATTFRPASAYPKAFVPVPIEDATDSARTFYDLIKPIECVKDAWRQEESTCWATATLNIITLTKSLRREFLAKHIEVGPLNPDGEAALAVQNAVACKSTDDAPFCAFSGPEMVCQLLRGRLDKGKPTASEFEAIMGAAGIYFGDGVHKLDRKWQLVDVSKVTTEEGLKRNTEPLFDLRNHAASAFIHLKEGTSRHVVAGIRCTGDKPGKYKYFIPDSYIMYEFDWLDACLNPTTTILQLRKIFKWWPRLEQVEFTVLCNTTSTYV